jgi:hypothetical protein
MGEVKPPAAGMDPTVEIDERLDVGETTLTGVTCAPRLGSLLITRPLLPATEAGVSVTDEAVFVALFGREITRRFAGISWSAG